MRMIFSELLGRFVRLLTAARRYEMHSVQGMFPQEVSRHLPDRLGLYVHVPFCERICDFCPYNKTLFEPSLAARYVEALGLESALYLPHLRRRKITSLYIGGGTPTLLPELIEQLCVTAEQLGAANEIGVEVLPGHAKAPLLSRLRRAGVNYLSVGVQSFDNRVLRYLGRNHNARIARSALQTALGEGFDCVDVDLVFDVVRFGSRGVIEDSEQVFQMGADQLSVYPMMRFSYTPLGVVKEHDEQAEKKALKTIGRISERYGYQRTSVWTFNKNPAHRYTSITREFYLGLGPSASSFLDGIFTVNSFDTKTYAELLEQGRSPVVLQSSMGPRVSMAYYLFWRFYEGVVDRQRFRRLFGMPIERAFPGLLALMRLVNAVRLRGGQYALTPWGFDLFHTVERWVTYNFIEPLWATCRQHPFPESIRL